MPDSDSWSNGGDVPCPEETLQIIEKHSGKPITLAGDELKLRNVKDTSHRCTHWHCVKQNGYFGFQNPQTGRYLGHDGKTCVQAAMCHLKGWELWTPRGIETGATSCFPRIILIH